MHDDEKDELIMRIFMVKKMVLIMMIDFDDDDDDLGIGSKSMSAFRR